MNKHDVLATIREVGLVPVIRAESPEAAGQAIDAIRAGGVPILEITMTVPGAVGLIADVARRYGKDAVVGAGTVLDPETARACILAGACFVVSPSLNLETIACCRRYGVAVLPGALTPTEVVAAWQAGADMVKVFPAGNVGGPKYIKALKGPFPQIEMIPTGGVSLTTAADFLKAGACAVAVGGELVDAKTIKEGKYEVFEERSRQFLEVVAKARAEMAA